MKLSSNKLANFPQAQQDKYATIIGKEHYKLWGKYLADKTENDWIRWQQDSNKNIEVLINKETEEFIGSYSIKQDNMGNRYDLHPWLSGFALLKEYTRNKIGGILMAIAMEDALTRDIKKIYLFTHNLDLIGFYKKFAWQQMTDEAIQAAATVDKDQPPSYKGEPIVIFEGDPKKILEASKNYLKEYGIYYDPKTDIYEIDDSLINTNSSVKKLHI